MLDNQISCCNRNGVFVLKTKCVISLFIKDRWIEIPKGFEAVGYPKTEECSIEGNKMRIFLLFNYLKDKGVEK